MTDDLSGDKDHALSLVPKRKIRWAQLSDAPLEQRLVDLSQTLARDFKIENELELLSLDLEKFRSGGAELAQNEKSFFEQLIGFDLVRVVGGWMETLPAVLTSQPASMLSVRMCDALVRSGAGWWPRSYLPHAIQQVISKQITKLDSTGSVFILGATPQTRAIVEALVKMGFRRFSISDGDEPRATKLVQELKTIYFRNQFQFVHRKLITQLPGIFSFAANTLDPEHDDGIVSELFYFNFLSPQGVWFDFHYNASNQTLRNEAEAVGASILSGSEVAGQADRLWLEQALGILV